MPVQHDGTYAISVRHDVDGSGRTEMSDGAAMSGNPDVSLMDILLKRKPSPAQVAIEVRGTTVVPVVLNYIHGMSVGPVASAAR